MRYYEKSQITLSEDSTNPPKQIRLSESFDDVDVELLKDVIIRQETFPVGSHSISLGNIAEGRYFLIKPKAQIQCSINGAPAYTLRANKVTKGWLIFNAITITVSTQPVEVLIVLAGE